MPGTPVDDLNNASSAATNLANLTYSLQKAMGASDKDAHAAAEQDASTLTKMLGFLGQILHYLVIAVTPLILFFLNAITNVRETCGDQMAAIGGAVLSEFLGTEIVIPSIKTKQGSDGNLAVSKALGNALYTQLLTEFGPAQPLQPGDGERAAKIFSGYAINFAVQNAMISTLTDAMSLHYLQDFKEIGVEVAQNLGLGRLQRLALGTLLQQVIQKPYQRDLAAKYRPDRLSVAEQVHAYHRGELDRTAIGTELAQEGYRDQDIQALINEYDTKLSVGECMLLIRYGLITQNDAEKQLVSQGMSADIAAFKIRAAQLAIINDNVTAYATALGELKKNGRMDPDTYTQQMQIVPWTDDEKTWTARATGAALDFPDMKLTFAQVTTAFEQGIVDVDYVDRWLRFQQYSDEDVLNMELLLAVKFDAFVAKAEATAAALAKKNAAKTPPPPAA